MSSSEQDRQRNRKIAENEAGRQVIRQSQGQRPSEYCRGHRGLDRVRHRVGVARPLSSYLFGQDAIRSRYSLSESRPRLEPRPPSLISCPAALQFSRLRLLPEMGQREIASHLLYDWRGVRFLAGSLGHRRR
jgi:hypothetical protein